jgi:acetylornithine/succinyldiaminopimelate/putrescine aminotransferase
MPSHRELFFRYLGHTSTAPRALEFASAKGEYLIKENGEKFLDLVSGFSVSNIGHSHPKIVKAVQEQAALYMHQTVYGEFIQSPQLRLAEKLASLLPKNLDCTYFVNSGSESIETAMKLARRHTQSKQIIFFKNAYHGSTQGALSILGNEEMKSAFSPLIPECKELIFNDFEMISQISNETACVIIEPIQAEAGIILPLPGFLTAIRNRCNKTGTLLIFDEIQTGFGRTGKLFAFEKYNVVPDVLCLAKAMGGGMPLGAVISSSEILKKFTYEPMLGHITTFGGHPVCAAAGLAALEVLVDEKLLENVEAKAQIFYNILIKNQYIREIRMDGLLIAFDLDNENFAEEIRKELINQHIVVESFLFRPKALRITPPLIIQSEICQQSAIIIDTVINKIHHDIH